MPSFAAERYEFCEYFSGSGAMTCLVVRRTAELCLVRFRTADWGSIYDGFSFYGTTVLFPEHLRPADPTSPGVRHFVEALTLEQATRQRYAAEAAANCKHQANGRERRRIENVQKG